MNKFRLKRRQFLKGAIGALTMKAGASASTLTQPRPKNIVFILADDMRWDAFGRAGNPNLKTPNLDWLAKTGHQFENHFVTTSICPTSRASIYTGQYARRHGIWDFSTALSKNQLAASFPAKLKDSGFRTGFFGKWGIGQSIPDNTFDHWDGFVGQGAYFEANNRDHLTDRLSQSATDWLDSHKSRIPKALFICTKAPHVQDEIPGGFLPPDRYADLYANTTFEASPSATLAQFDALPDFLKTSEGRRRWQNRFSSPELFQNTVRRYHRLIRGIDDLVGNVVKALQKSGEIDQTMFVFTSDNGFLLGEHGLAGKWWGYEESIRIPLIIKLPAKGPLRGSKINALSLNIDLAPTILEYAGAPIPDTMQGQSLKSLISGAASDFRNHFLYEHFFSHPKIAQTIGTRGHEYKYLSYPGEDKPNEMLFHLTSDPFELNNLARNPEYINVLDEHRLLTLRMLNEYQ